MPELPEVETVARALRGRLRDRAIVGVHADHPGVYIPAGGLEPAWPHRIEGVGRRGKFLWIALEGELRVVVHLRMTGHLAVVGREEERRPHTHVRFALDSGQELRFVDPRRFGRVWLETVRSLEERAYWNRLGPEPLNLDPAGLAARLGPSRSAVKVALLDQHRLAGIGNIYADEILHAAGIHPRQPANTILEREWPVLHACMHAILGSAIAGGGSTIRDYRSADGRSGSFQEAHRVFGRGGEPCSRCATTIRKIRLASRGTHFCPACQPFRRRRPRPRDRRGFLHR